MRNPDWSQALTGASILALPVLVLSLLAIKRFGMLYAGDPSAADNDLGFRCALSP